MITIEQNGRIQTVNDTSKFTPEIARAIIESLGYQPEHGSRVTVTSQRHNNAVALTGRTGSTFKSYIRMTRDDNHPNAWIEASVSRFRS